MSQVDTQRHDAESFVLPTRSMETLEMSQACHYPTHVCHVSFLNCINCCADTRRWFESPSSKRPKIARERVPSISEIRAKKSAQEEMFQTSRSNRVSLNKRQPPPPLVKLPEKNVITRLNREHCVLSHPGQGPQKGTPTREVISVGVSTSCTFTSTPATKAAPVSVTTSCFHKRDNKGHGHYSRHDMSSKESGEGALLPRIKGPSIPRDETCNGSRSHGKLLEHRYQLLSQEKPLSSEAKHLQELKSVPNNQYQPLKSIIAKTGQNCSVALTDECATCVVCKPEKEVKLFITKEKKCGSLMPGDTPITPKEPQRTCHRAGPNDTREPHKSDSPVQKPHGTREPHDTRQPHRSDSPVQMRSQIWAGVESQLCQRSSCRRSENSLTNRMDFQRKSDSTPCNDAKMYTDINPNVQPADRGGSEKSMSIISNEASKDRPSIPRFKHHQKQHRTMEFDERYERCMTVPSLCEQHPQIVRVLSQDLPQKRPHKQCGESQRECDGLQVKQVTTSPTRECRNEPTKLDKRVEKRMPKLARTSKLVAHLHSDTKEESITSFCGGYAYDHQSLPKIIAVHSFVRDGNQKPSQRTHSLFANEIEQLGESQTGISREITIAGDTDNCGAFYSEHEVSDAPHTTKNNSLSEDISAKEVHVTDHRQSVETANVAFSMGKDFDIQPTNCPETLTAIRPRDNCGVKDLDKQSGTKGTPLCVESNELTSIGENCSQESLCRRKKATVGDLSRKILETRCRIAQEEIKWKKKLLYSLEGVLIKKLKKLERETGEKADISIVENDAKDKTGSAYTTNRQRTNKRESQRK